LSYFTYLYTNKRGVDSRDLTYFLESIPSLVSCEENLIITKEISKDKIKKVVWELAPDKSLSLDGFTIYFYKWCWSIIKYDLISMIKCVHKYFRIGGESNSSFLSLIPKEENHFSFSQLWPISLCNASYKIMTKIISHRLKILLQKIISDNQGGFMEKRKIMDNIISVQEAILSGKIKGGWGILIKLDMANAFNRVKQSLCFDVLQKFGFYFEFTNWISTCISNPRISPLVNGCPLGFFKAKKSLRHVEIL